MTSPPAKYILKIAHFHAASSPDTTSSDALHEATSALRGTKVTHTYTLGTQIQDKNEIQLTSEWNGAGNAETTTSTSDPLANSLHSIYGEPKNIYHAALNRPAFGPNGAATASVVEFAQSWFPASDVTLDFKAQIEADFLRFNDICEGAAKGNLDWAMGWISEEQEHENIDGKATCFLVLRGWESMGDFERLTKNAAFPGAIQILLAWNAPFKMWHVERVI